MHIRSQQLGARGVSMDMKISRAAQEDSTFPNLENMARFQQKQLQEKEQKLLQLYDQQQQRAYQVVQRGSAGSRGSNGSNTVRSTTTSTTTATTTHTSSTSQGGKVRQMFDERRQTTVKGIDRSYPLEPLENKLRKQANTNGLATQKNGNVTVNRQSMKRVARADVNSNINGGKPVVSYHEEITRESFGPSMRRHIDDEDEYVLENRVATFGNGYYRHEDDNEQEEMLDQETMERNRMMAKIHLMGFDETLKHRVRNDLEGEEFPEYLMVDAPDKLSKRNVTKKLSQAEERLERFKNTNAKRSNMSKQSTSTRKRSEQVIPTKSNSRPWSEIAGTSPISARSGSSRGTSESRQRILENAKSPPSFRTRVVDEMHARQREGSDTETFSQRTSPRSFATRDVTKAEAISRIYPRNNEFKSLTSDGKIIVRRSASPQFFCRESERSGTTMSIDRRSDSSGSPLLHRETLTEQRRISPFFLNESRRTSEPKSPIWGNTRIWSRQNVTPLFDEKIFKRRGTSPQFFCRESERSATTMSIDRAAGESKSPSYGWEMVKKRSASPRFLLNEFKSPTWNDGGILSRQSASQQYLRREYKGAETATSTDRETVGSKASEWSKGTERNMIDFERKKVQTNTSLDRQSPPSKSPLYDEKILKRRSTSPQFFCRESERSATTMSIDRVTGESKSPPYDWRIATKRGTSPRFFLNESKSPIWNKKISSRQSTSPRYLHRESKRSETATSTDRKTIESKLSEWNKGMLTKQGMADFERQKVQTGTSLGRQSPLSKSPLYEEKILKRRSTSPQFFCRESERSATTMSVDRATSESKSPSYDRETVTKRSTRPRFLLSDSEQSRRTSESKSPIWSDRRISSRQSTSPQYFSREFKRSGTATSTDRETIASKSSEWSKGASTKRSTTDFERKKVQTSTSLGRQALPSKSALYEQKMLRRRSTSPQFFCRESERSATTMSIDRATSESKSPSYDREIVTKRDASPRFFLSDSEQSRRTSESKSPIWDRGTSPRQSTSPQYFTREFKRSETATSTDRETAESKSSEWSKRNTSPRFFCRESERSGTTMSIDRKVGEPRSSIWYDQKVLTKRSAAPRLNGKAERRSASTRTSVDRKYNEVTSRGITRDKRSTSPQFFCKESERSATTTLIEPRSRPASSTKNILKQRNYASDTSYRQSVKSPIHKKIGSTKYRHTPSPPVTRHEVKRASKKDRVTSSVTGARRSSKISEISTTSASSIVNLKYGLEFDDIFQSVGLVRKLMKSQNGKQRAIRQSPSKRSTYKDVNARISARGNQSRNRHETSPPFQTARSPTVKGGKRATPEFPRKSITPTEVDMDIQEITMTDHRIERDKLQKASSPIPKRECDGTYMKSSSGKAKFKTSITYPVRKTRGQRESVLGSKDFKSEADASESRVGSRRATSPDFSRVGKYPDTISPILCDGTKGARAKFDQPLSLRSARLTQVAVKDGNLSANDECNRERGRDEGKNVAVDEVDAGTGVKYQTAVEAALSGETKDYPKIARPNSAEQITSEKVVPHETTQKPMKSSTSKRTISPTRECSRRHDVQSRVSRVSPLRKTAETCRIYAKTPSFRSTVSNADQISASKFSTHPVKDRERDSVLVAKKLAESFDKVSVKRKSEEPRDEFFKVRRFDTVGAKFERSCQTSFRTIPGISLRTMDSQAKAPVKVAIASEGTTGPSREVADHTTLRSTLKSPVGKGLKAKNAACKSDLRILQKETRFSGKPAKVAGTIESKRSAKIRSPTCKRRLFEFDSEKGIHEERSKTSCARARKDENCSLVNFRVREDEAVSSVRSFEGVDVTRESEETSTFSVKPLRSIENIRKSIDNERHKLAATEESRSAIANRRWVSREGVDARRGRHPTTDAAKNVFLDLARLTKIKSCVSRMTKSPSPESAMTKQRETNLRARGSTPSSPSKSPDVASRRTTAESRNQETKSSRRTTVARGADSIGNKAVDNADGIVYRNDSPNESTTRKSDAFTIDFDDRPSREDDAIPSKKSPIKKSNDKQQTASSASGRPTSSNSSVNLIQDSSAKGRMAENERAKGLGKGGGKNKGKGIEKPSSSNGKLANAPSFNEDATNDTKGLVKCKMCGRSFAQNRISLHEEICVKTMTKKRKQFDPVMSRVKGTELEPFVKKGLSKRETKTKKPETKTDWRRKHEDFINTIRYARETQARLAAGGNLNDLPPPPPSDTSDYVECEHCGRKFNRSAAERHIPICKRMHDKKQTQAPRAPRR
ncbi:uncharacterized protein LOC105196285 isoform X1 [Solenopsis invicta]|uniref:uncharacterized protein LOC105196285 isoform X1 n=1 Tax=Solenopsis invicta TaxID=13686 RepID=UPI00193DD79F|nr:uncharacterized protein LOC105196285 isoform X1 [Solenopsis invicta]